MKNEAFLENMQKDTRKVTRLFSAGILKWLGMLQFCVN